MSARGSTDPLPPPHAAGVPAPPAPGSAPGPGDPEDPRSVRILVLLRHAHAEPYGAGGDLSRELSSAGRDAATALGRWLVAQGLRPDVVVVSPSTRTLQTWEALRRGGVRADDVWMDRALYGAEPDDIVESVNAVPDDVRTLLVIGHAPAIGDLAARLEDHTDSSPAQLEARAAWSPGSLGIALLRGSWADFPGPAVLASFHSA